MTSSTTVGPAGLVAGLTEAGFEVRQVNGFAVFDYAVEVGSKAGETVRVGLELLGDWPVSAPHGPHVSPRLGHPHGAVHASPLGPDWEHWSRPVLQWARDRSVGAYLRHLRSLFAQL